MPGVPGTAGFVVIRSIAIESASKSKPLRWTVTSVASIRRYGPAGIEIVFSPVPGITNVSSSFLFVLLIFTVKPGREREVVADRDRRDRGDGQLGGHARAA